MKVRKKPIDIDARGPITTPEMVTTAHGRVRAEAGDYVLSDPRTGDIWPIKPDIYADTYYEPSAAPASEPLDSKLRELSAKWRQRSAYYSKLSGANNYFEAKPRCYEECADDLDALLTPATPEPSKEGVSREDSSANNC